LPFSKRIFGLKPVRVFKQCESAVLIHGAGVMTAGKYSEMDING
jgi:hypothetical protein